MCQAMQGCIRPSLLPEQLIDANIVASYLVASVYFTEELHAHRSFY